MRAASIGRSCTDEPINHHEQQRALPWFLLTRSGQAATSAARSGTAGHAPVPGVDCQRLEFAGACKKMTGSFFGIDAIFSRSRKHFAFTRCCPPRTTMREAIMLKAPQALPAKSSTCGQRTKQRESFPTKLSASPSRHWPVG